MSGSDFFALVVDPDGDEIVPPARDRECARKILRLKIGDEENDRATGDDVVQIIEREARQRAAALRLEKKNFANQTQGVGAPFLRRNEKLDLIGEEKEPDLVVVADGAEGEQTGDFRRQLAFRLCRRCRNFPKRSRPPPA